MMEEEEISGKTTGDSGRVVPRRAPWIVDSFKSLPNLNQTLNIWGSGIGSGSIRCITPNFIGPINGFRRGREAARSNPSLTKLA